MSVIAVFGSGIAKTGSYEYKTAEFLGKKLAGLGFSIVTGGYLGVMEAALKGASTFDVKRIGVITDFFEDKQANVYVNKIIRTENYIERLLKLTEIADAYIVLPGGTGTFLELSLIWAFKDKGIIKEKPLISIGEQWQEVTQTLSFYSIGMLDKSFLLEQVERVDEALEKIVNHFELDLVD